MIRIRRSSAGKGSLEELARCIAEAKSSDPLAPVWVIAPSYIACQSLRYTLARTMPTGLTAVRFGTSTNLAYAVASRSGALSGLRPVDELARRTLVSQAVAEAVEAVSPRKFDPERLLGLFTAATSLDSLGHVFEVLDERCVEEELAKIRSGPRFGELPLESRVVLDAYLKFCRLRSGRYLDTATYFEVAAESLGRPSDGEWESVVWYLPLSLTAQEESLARSLAQTVRLDVILGFTGDKTADSYISSVGKRFAEIGQDVPGAIVEVEYGEVPVDAPPRPNVATAFDAYEEARSASRLAQRWCAEGADPLHIGIVYTTAHPYRAALTQSLEAGGIPFWGTRHRSVGETGPGAVLRGIAEVLSSDFRRDALVSLANTLPAPERAFAYKNRTYRAWPEQWDLVTRTSGVVSDLDEWRRCFRGRLRVLGGKSGSSTAESSTAKSALALSDVLAPLEPLSEGLIHAASLDGVGKGGGEGETPSWAQAADSILLVLENLLGASPAKKPGVGDGGDDRAAYVRIREGLRRLGQLDAAGIAYDPERLAGEIGRLLGEPISSGTRPEGICLAALHDAVGAVLDAVWVAGATDESLPVPASPSSFLEPLEAALGGSMSLSSVPPPQEQRARLYTVLCSATRSVLSYPIADLERRRGARPSWWCLELATSARGAHELVGHDELAAGKLGDWHLYVPSLEAGLSELGPADEQEVRLMKVLYEMAGGRPFEETSVVKQDSLLARRVAREEGLRSELPDEWWGFLGGGNSRRALFRSDEIVLRPTELEQWCACPYRYFLGSVLGVGRPEAPEEAEEVAPADLGTVVHAALKRLLSERTPPDPSPEGEARRYWKKRLQSLRRRLPGIVREEFDKGRKQGVLLGPERWLKVLEHRVIRSLEVFVVLEVLLEREFGAWPVALEHKFDKTEHFGKRRIALRIRGRADRIDQVELPSLGPAVAVIDYKTTSRRRGDLNSSWQNLERIVTARSVEEAERLLEAAEGTGMAAERVGVRDLVNGGSFLQVPLYLRQALRKMAPEAELGLASIWSLNLTTAENVVLGGVIGRTELDEVDAFVGGITDAILDGIFVPYPGEDGYYGPENCRFCDFDPVCPLDRVRIADRKLASDAYWRFHELTSPEQDEVEGAY